MQCIIILYHACPCHLCYPPLGTADFYTQGSTVCVGGILFDLYGISHTVLSVNVIICFYFLIFQSQRKCVASSLIKTH